MLRLVKDMKIGRLKDEYFLYSSPDSALCNIEIQKINKETYQALKVFFDLSKETPLIEREEAARGLGKNGHEIISYFLANGCIEPAETERRPGPGGKRSKTSPGLDAFVCPPTFFNVPPRFPDKKADAAIVGVPYTTHLANHGATVGIELLRAYSANKFDWFQIFEKGIYSEIGLNNKPRFLCEGLVPKDFGNVGTQALSLSQLTSELTKAWKKLHGLRIKPLFVGGDHFVTYPILAALHKAQPDFLKRLTIVHLDAHHDCYQEGETNISHSAVFSSILSLLPVKKIVSLGLRTKLDMHGAPEYADNLKEHIKKGRLFQYGIYETQAMLRDSSLLSLFKANEPVYLTFDVDFLCAQLVEGAVWTPVNGGATWEDLHRCLDLLRSKVKLVGGDIVEYNPLGSNATKVLKDLVAYMVHFLDTLGPRGLR